MKKREFCLDTNKLNNTTDEVIKSMMKGVQNQPS